MFPFSFFLFIAGSAVLLAWRDTLRNDLLNFLNGSFAWAQVQAIDAHRYIMRTILNLVIIASVLVGLVFTGAALASAHHTILHIPVSALHYAGYCLMIASLALAVAPLFVAMYAFYGLRVASGAASTALANTAATIQAAGIPTVIPAPSTPYNWLNALLFVPVAIVNVFYLPISLVISASAGALNLLSALAKVAEDSFNWVSRLVAFINLYVLVLLGLVILDYQAGTHIINLMVMGLAALFLVSYLTFAYIMDWVIPPRGGFWTATLGIILALSVYGILIYGAADPVMAKGLGQNLKNFHFRNQKSVNTNGANNAENRFPRYRVTQDVTPADIFERRESEEGETYFVPLDANSKNVIIPKDTKVTWPGPAAEVDQSTPTVFEKIYAADKGDPTMSQVNIRKDRHFWVRQDVLEPEGSTAAKPNGVSSSSGLTSSAKAGYSDQYITVNVDGSWTVTVPSWLKEGVPLRLSDGREFQINPKDHDDIVATGLVDIGRGQVGPNGEAGYFDATIDGPYPDHVGGLEMWIGPNKGANRFLVGPHLTQGFNHSGVPTLRVIESLYGYGDGNKSAFTVTIRKVSP